jgi:hypothetical protein
VEGVEGVSTDLGCCDFCSQPITMDQGYVWVRCEEGSDERCMVHPRCMAEEEVWEPFYVEQSGGTWNVRSRDDASATVVRMPGPHSAYRVARIRNYPHEMLPGERRA